MPSDVDLDKLLKARDMLDAADVPENDRKIFPGKPPLVIWHKGCLDGFTSAWVVWRFAKKFGIAPEFHPGVYQEKELPDVDNRHVIMVDFSYPARVIEEIEKRAASVLILDHHKSAEEALKKWIKPFTDVSMPPPPGNCVAHFDQNLSGAGLCWKFFFEDEPVPMLVQHVQDRDLWKFEVPGTEQVCAALYAEDFDFDLWERLYERLETGTGHQFLEGIGESLLKAKRKEREQLKTIAQRMTIGGWPMPVVNAPWFYASELLNDLAATAASKAAASYHDDEKGQRKFSLRSVPGGPDVSEIAKKFGGGGHMRAAGFVAPYRGWMGDPSEDQKFDNPHHGHKDIP